MPRTKTTAVFPLQLAQPAYDQQALFGVSPQPAFLWLCIHLPDLALETVCTQKCAQQDNQPRAIYIESGSRCFIHSVSPAALAAGVAPHMTLSAAYALCPTLKVFDYDPQAEARQLTQLAKWAQAFTPLVSIEPPRSLLLEVQGSLRLFGGIQGLQHKIRTDFRHTWPYRFSLALAPTPIASLLLASAGRETVIEQAQALRSALGKLPLGVLVLEPKLLKRLSKIGAQQLRDLWRLPRDGLARRFGPGLLQYLDRALGIVPDPRVPYQMPQRFVVTQDLPMEVRNNPFILSAAQSLVAQLVAFLHGRDAGVTQILFYLHHHKQPPSRVKIGLRFNSRDGAQFLSLLAEYLNRLQLTAPVIKLSLVAKQLFPFVTHSDNLFTYQLTSADRQLADPNWQHLLAQLQNRLGQQAINGLVVQADHRPEYAWRYSEELGVAVPGDHTQQTARPLWLLPLPQCLPQRGAQPAVTIVSGPERLEGGWWQGQDMRRDYYVAIDNKGRHLWVFRDLAGDKRWYLHGLFG